MSCTVGRGKWASLSFLRVARRDFECRERMHDTMISHGLASTEHTSLRSRLLQVRTGRVSGAAVGSGVITAHTAKDTRFSPVAPRSNYGCFPCVGVLHHSRQAGQRIFSYGYSSSSASSIVVRAFANVDPESLGAANPHRIQNLVQGQWRTTKKTYDVVDPLNGEVFIKSPFTQVRRSPAYRADPCSRQFPRRKTTSRQSA